MMSRRWVTMRDYPAIAALAGVSVEAVRDLLFPKMHSGIAVFDDSGDLSGFVIFKIGKKSTEIYALDAVPPDDERLLKIIEDLSIDRRKSAIRVNVSDRCPVAMLHRLNEDGFLAYKVIPDHYGEGHSAYRFQKLLKPLDTVAATK